MGDSYKYGNKLTCIKSQKFLNQQDGYHGVDYIQLFEIICGMALYTNVWLRTLKNSTVQLYKQHTY